MSLFGAPATSGAPTFSFGSTAPAASAAPATSTTPSLFGSTTPAAAPAAGGSLFGAAKPATPSLFGSTPAPAAGAAPATGGGLFGAPAASAAGAAAAPKPAFSFGTPAASAAPSATSAAPSLFGSTVAPAVGAAPAAGGGLFGATSAAAPAAGGLGGSLFGAKPAAPALGGSLFGGASTAAPTAAGGLTLGASTAAAPTAAAGPPGGITKTTKFNDLPDGARNVIEEMDKFIRQQTQLADELSKKDFGSEIQQTQRMYTQTAAEASTVHTLLTSTSRQLLALRQELDQSLSDVQKTTALIDAFKGKGAGGDGQGVDAAFPYEYFRRRAEEMKERVGRYKGTMEQISSLLSSPSSHSSSNGLTPTSLPSILKSQHTSLVALAASVSALDAELRALKDEFREMWRAKTGRMGMDPFPKQGGGNGASVNGVERGVGRLAV